MKKRLLSILLMCCMVLTMLPTAAFAEGGTEESSACTCETACTAESMNMECPVCGAEGADPENCKCATVESEQKAAPISNSSFPAEDLADPVIRIRLSPLGDGYYAIENGENCTRTAADFFQPGKAPKGAKITAVTPPTSPSIPVSVNVDSDGTLRCTKTEITTEIAFKSEPYTVTITSDDYARITAPLTVRQYLNAGFEGPVQFKNRVYGDTYTYTCRVNNLGKNGVWSALIQNPDIFEIYQETTDITSEPGKSIYTVQIRAIKASARVTWIDFLYLSDTTMASSKDSSTVTTGGTVSTRPLTVTAGSATITEGDALPTDLVTCTGILDSEGRKDDRDTVLDNALSYKLFDASNTEIAADTARNTPGTYTVVPTAALKSGWDERYSLNKVNGTLTVEKRVDEQFTLTPGGRYYFDLSAMNIPGTANGGNSDGAVSLPDTSLHYVPFTYAGTVDAYKLTSAMATTEEYAQQNKYAHSLFVADYAVTHKVNWNNLDTASLIFGKNYASGGVDYTLRAPSCGSGFTGSDDSERGTPQSNEWDAVLDKNSGYVKNWNDIYSWGQDTSSYESWYRAVRGYNSARSWSHNYATYSYPHVGFRPVLEVLNSDTLGSDGMKVVTLDLNGGKLGGSSEAIQIIVKNGSAFTAPMSGGLTRPDGDTGSYFMWLDGNGNSYEPGGSVPADVTTLTVQWTAPTYAVTLHTNGGTIADGKDVTGYTYGVGATLPTDVTRTGYTFKGWYDNEGLTGDPVTAIGNTETGNKEYWAKWEINQYTITYDLAGGTAEGNPNTYTIETGAFTLKNPTKSGYTFTGWSGTGLDGENNMTVTIHTGSTGNRTYTAHWRYNGSGHSYSYYTIKATAGAGGSIAPSGNVSVREGRDQTFTITPDKGYAVANVKIDGKSIGAVKSYTFENVRRTHTIEVIFMKANGNPQTGVFVDVATGSYYEDAVDWAVENGITKGTDDTHFSPDGICTRAQAVTFLWRTAGSPKPETRTMPFTDVPAGSYYYDAVLWAVENGITKGTSDTTFSPNSTCTRAQIVAFLWRSEKSPAAGSRNPFADVKSSAYYADAVLWAVENDITKGTTNTTFSPNADCTRAQIVTFLWRCKK